MVPAGTLEAHLSAPDGGGSSGGGHGRGERAGRAEEHTEETAVRVVGRAAQRVRHSRPWWGRPPLPYPTVREGVAGQRAGRWSADASRQAPTISLIGTPRSAANRSRAACSSTVNRNWTPTPSRTCRRGRRGAGRPSGSGRWIG